MKNRHLAEILQVRFEFVNLEEPLEPVTYFGRLSFGPIEFRLGFWLVGESNDVPHYIVVQKWQSEDQQPPVK